MKALRKLAAADEHLELVEVPEPKPEPGWVVLEVTYAGICGTDLHIAHNQFPSWPPVTLGHEFCGRVADVGAEVEGWLPGDRVVCEPHSLACGRCHLCRRGHAELCAAKRSPGWGIDGGMAAQVAVPAHLLHRVPDAVSDLVAAMCEPTAIAVTAAERMPVEPGSTVAVFGPGAVGLLAAMVTRACGAGRTVVVGRASSRARLELAGELGFDTWEAGGTDGRRGPGGHRRPWGRPGAGVLGVGRGGRGRDRRPAPAGAAVRARHERPPRPGGALGPGHAAGP